MRAIAGLVVAGALMLVLGCGGKDTSTDGTVNVHLVDGPVLGFQEVNVNIQRVEIGTDSGWITLGTPGKTYNLLALTGGVSEMLASGATLPAGHYGQMRLILGTGNTVKLADGTVKDLTVPSGLQTGVKLVVSFDVAAGTTKDVWIDFDAAHSVQLTGAGNSGKYLLRPTVWAYDKVVTGSISGVLTDANGGAPLAGVTVYAETLDGAGQPSVVRSTLTSSTGAYTLDLLPVGTTYYVVSMPRTGTTTVKVYDAKASAAYALSAASPVFTYSTSFAEDTSLGGVSGAITPVATDAQSDVVQLMQTLATGSSGTGRFVVDSQVAMVGTLDETFAFTQVPAGSYALRGLRRTLATDGSTTTTVSSVVTSTITAGGTATANVAF